MLVLPARDVSTAQFEAAFREHRRALIRFLRRRVGNEDDAAEIAQEAYLRLLRYAGHADARALKALLYRIAINLVAMRAREIRARQGQVEVSHDVSRIESDEAGQLQRLIDRERLSLLLEAIRGLPEKCRQVFVLSRFHDMSYPQIAAHCGISVKMVEKHITKALSVCRDKVGGEPS